MSASKVVFPCTSPKVAECASIGWTSDNRQDTCVDEDVVATGDSVDALLIGYRQPVRLLPQSLADGQVNSLGRSLRVRIKKNKSRGFSKSASIQLCLHGPPGTGPQLRRTCGSRRRAERRPVVPASRPRCSFAAPRGTRRGCRCRRRRRLRRSDTKRRPANVRRGRPTRSSGRLLKTSRKTRYIDFIIRSTCTSFPSRLPGLELKKTQPSKGILLDRVQISTAKTKLNTSKKTSTLPCETWFRFQFERGIGSHWLSRTPATNWKDRNASSWPAGCRCVQPGGRNRKRSTGGRTRTIDRSASQTCCDPVSVKPTIAIRTTIRNERTCHWNGLTQAVSFEASVAGGMRMAVGSS